MFFLKTNNLWFERLATVVFVVFNSTIEPICASITKIEFVLALIRSSYHFSMFLIGAQCSTPAFSQTNILTSILSLSKPSTGLNNSNLPSPQGVYTQIIILYNFCVPNP